MWSCRAHTVSGNFSLKEWCQISKIQFSLEGLPVALRAEAADFGFWRPDTKMALSNGFECGQEVLHHPDFIGGLPGRKGDAPSVRVESHIVQVNLDVDLPWITTS